MTTINPMMVRTMALRRLPLANLRVGGKADCGSNAVVAPVERLKSASVVCGRRLVSISLEDVESLGAAKESLTRGVPSAREGERVVSLNSITCGTTLHSLSS